MVHICCTGCTHFVQMVHACCTDGTYVHVLQGLHTYRVSMHVIQVVCTCCRDSTHTVQVVHACCTCGIHMMYRCCVHVVQVVHCYTGVRTCMLYKDYTHVVQVVHTVQVRRYDMSTSLALTKWPPNIRRILKHAISSLRVTLQAQQTYLNSLLTFILFISLFQISVIIQ